MGVEKEWKRKVKFVYTFFSQFIINYSYTILSNVIGGSRREKTLHGFHTLRHANNYGGNFMKETK